MVTFNLLYNLLQKERERFNLLPQKVPLSINQKGSIRKGRCINIRKVKPNPVIFYIEFGNEASFSHSTLSHFKVNSTYKLLLEQKKQIEIISWSFKVLGIVHCTNYWKV